MAKQLLKKAMLYAGRTYHSPDGKVTVTPERLKHWHDQFQKLSQNNYVAPIDWDHAKTAKDAEPVAASRFTERSAKNTVGKLAAFNVAPDGSHAELLLDITDPQAKGRAKRNEVYVSPIIFPQWKDGAGNEYSDVITHVDLVNHPVDNSQKPFVPAEPGTLAMGIRMGLSQVYRMATDDNPFEDDDDEESGDGEEGSDDPTETMGGDSGESKPGESKADENPDMPKVEGDDKIAEAIVAHLDQLGVSLPADWTFGSDAAAEILLTGLKTALKAKQTAEAESQSDEDDDDNPFSNSGESNMKQSDPGFAAMSLQARTALTFAEKQHRDGLTARAEKCLKEGRCSPQQHSDIAAGIPAIRLSLNNDGQHQATTLEERLAVLEQNPPGTFWDEKTRTEQMERLSLSTPPLKGDEDAENYARELLFGKKK